MQIQRIQTVYIFLSIIAMAVFMFVPYGEIVSVMQQADAMSLYTMTEYGILVPVCAIIILLLIDLFLYRNLPLQRTVLVISLMLTLAVIATVCFTLFKEARAEGIDAHFTVWDILLPIVALLEILGVKGINNDIKLLNSYNRLR
ncbi:DUF4293 family protein [uncultured Duncaniella sp.]|uniref:DUF4293 family protein n=1 Tax=uncultured Duncaniella sp. TaxID=2768039 RepID=UPI0025F7B886|nr:DUF4293 family protein [uncultured Duncaniella sp.]